MSEIKNAVEAHIHLIIRGVADEYLMEAYPERMDGAVNSILAIPELAIVDREAIPPLHPCQACAYYETGEDEDGEYATCIRGVAEGQCTGIKAWKFNAGWVKEVKE